MKTAQPRVLFNRLGLMIGGMIVGLSVVLFGISAVLMLNQTGRLENELISIDIQRGQDLLKADLDRLVTLASSYAVRDDSYQYVASRDPAYVSRNYTPQAFNDGQMDLVLMLNLDGGVLVEKAFDSGRQEFVSPPPGMRPYLRPGLPILALDQPEDLAAGFLALPEGPLMVAAHPVLTSEGKGPVRSVLVFGRFLNRKAVGDWADLAHLSLDMRPYNLPELPADFLQVRAGLAADPEKTVIQILSQDRIAAYALIADLAGNPAFILRVDAPRELYRQTLIGMGLTALSLTVIGLFFGAIAYLLIARLVQAQRVTEKVITRLKAIGELSRTLSVSPGIQELTHQLLVSLYSITGCYNVNLFVIRGDEMELLAGEGGYVNGTPRRYRIPLNSGIIGHAAASGKYLLVGDVSRSPYFQFWEGLPNTRSELALPVKLGGQVLGVLDLQSEIENGFDAADLEALQVLANQLAVALDNSRLYEEVRGRAAEMESLLDVSARRLQQMESLRTVDMAITASLDLSTILQVMLEQVQTQLNVDAASVLLYHPQTQVLEYAAKRGFVTDALQHTHLRLGDGFAGRAALEQRVVHITDLRRQLDDLSRSPLLGQEGFITYLGVPLLVKGQLKGVLEIFQRQIFQPEAEWLKFLESLSRQTAIAIENAMLMEGLEQANRELIAAYDATIEGWAQALELRDFETAGHSRRVTDMTLELGQAMNLSPDDLVHLRRGALLHDIGKLGVPDAILKKPGPLSEPEWAEMRRHPLYSFQMLSPIPFLRPALDIPYCHHEKWDGSGYPRGLHDELIPLAARIFAVVDVWDAVTHDRYYNEAWTRDRAAAFIREQAGRHFDAEVVQVFLERVIDPKRY